MSSYTHGPGIDDPSIMNYDGSDYFFHKNHLGSVTEITDIYQNTVKTYDYDAFGAILAESGSLDHNAFTYTGREYHLRSGLYHYRARFYDSSVGRFITPDPIGHLGGMNLYAYVGNAPMVLVDPLGLEAGMGYSIESAEIFGEGLTGIIDRGSRVLPGERWFMEHATVSYSLFIITFDLDGNAYFNPIQLGISGDYSFDKTTLGPADYKAAIFFRHAGVGVDIYEERNEGCVERTATWTDGFNLHVGLGVGLPVWIAPYIGNVY